MALIERRDIYGVRSVACNQIEVTVFYYYISRMLSHLIPNPPFYLKRVNKLGLAIPCLLMVLVMLAGCASYDSALSTSGSIEQKNPDEVKLMVLYPQPTDVVQFDKDYQDHLVLLNDKANIPADASLPYTVTKFLPTPDGPPDFYQVFIMTFPSAQAMQQAMSTPGMQEVAADAARISTGGAPVVLIGNEMP